MTATVIVGNGIGMALDPNYFALTSGIEAVEKQLSEEEIKLISLGSKNQAPRDENELEKQHAVLTACKTLINYQNNELQWLSQDGNDFPNVYQNFIYLVAKYFFEYPGSLPDAFVERLCEFVKKDRCHIVTLNYDKLLYEALIRHDVLAGYKDNGLVDGIHTFTDGFKPDNLTRTFNNFGWYLHLHGSPVFRSTANDRINKCKINDLPKNSVTEEGEHNHIVLTNTRLKPGIISRSRLLSTYFDFFIKALDESDKVYLFGYSGRDEHINFQVKDWFCNNDCRQNRNLMIVEWRNDNDSDKDRTDFWSKNIGCGDVKKFNERAEIIRKEDILKYEITHPINTQ